MFTDSLKSLLWKMEHTPEAFTGPLSIRVGWSSLPAIDMYQTDRAF